MTEEEKERRKENRTNFDANDLMDRIDGYLIRQSNTEATYWIDKDTQRSPETDWQLLRRNSNKSNATSIDYNGKLVAAIGKCR